MKRFIRFAIVIMGILSILIGIIGFFAFMKDGQDNTFVYAFAFLLGGIFLPEVLIAFFEDDEEEEDE